MYEQAQQMNIEEIDVSIESDRIAHAKITGEEFYAELKIYARTNTDDNDKETVEYIARQFADKNEGNHDNISINYSAGFMGELRFKTVNAIYNISVDSFEPQELRGTPAV